MVQKIKSNHPFSTKQLYSLNQELQKISETQIISLRGITIPAKKNYSDIKILKSPYYLSVFLSFIDISDSTNPKFKMYSISIDGTVDYEVKQNMTFNNLSDRITFFNELEKIEFNY